MLLSEAQKYLEIVRKRGEEKGNLERVYYNIIKHKGLFYIAYNNLYANDGATTPGVDPIDTVEGMSEEKIETIIKRLKKREYQWKPTRRTYILKRDGKSQRPLGIPGWEDKLLQEVIRLVLEAYYEPQFRENSHGFRPQRGCHTALMEIKTKWTGTNWFIEGDIKGCFDNINHAKLLEVIGRNIKDGTFIHVLKDMLKAGYVEAWKYHKTYSGTPQGGIISPLLSNIMLHEMDGFIEEQLIPRYTKGKKRQENPENRRLRVKAWQLRKKGEYQEAAKLRQKYTRIPSTLTRDPDYRRLRYVRYADDFLLGLIGTKEDAETIKQEIKRYLETGGLEMSEEKTLITHAVTERARFLNYEIGILRCDEGRTPMKIGNMRTSRRSLNGGIRLTIPKDVIQKWKAAVVKENKVQHRTELMNLSEYDIISLYETQLQGLINYYILAQNVSREMYPLRYYYKRSLIKTLALKLKTSCRGIIRKFTVYPGDGKKVIGVIIPRKGKQPLKAVFGKKSIQTQKRTIIVDKISKINTERTELIQRLLAEKCELCGKEGEKVYGHHIRKLKDLKKKHRGKKDIPAWVKQMIAIKRKTLFVCKECHCKIHSGSYDGASLT